MALRAGYKGIKKKYADEINRGEGGGDPGGGGINYSTDEQDTGLKWIDGRSVYQKTFVFTGITGNTFNSPVLNLDIDLVVDLSAYMKLGSGGGNTWISLPFIETASYIANCNYHGNNDRLQFVSGNWGLTDAIVTIKYVKTEV